MNTVSLSGAAYRQLLIGGAKLLENNKETVNNLNVFPVPDGDTGTNMSLTMSAVSADRHSEMDSLDAYSAAVAKDMMRSARGNSGVILSLFFRGMARAFQSCEAADVKTVQNAFREGAKSAASAVENPVEGTILTVMRECCAEDAGAEDIETLLDIFYDKAVETLKKTPEMLPALRRARVVDSGGCGFVHIVDGMRRALRGEVIADEAAVSEDGAAELNDAADFSEFDTEDIKFSFCTECLLDLDGEIAPNVLSELRAWLSSMGDSMVLTADEEIFKLHVHTNEPLTVLDRVTKLGTLRFSKVENMKLQHDGIAVAPKKEKEKKKDKKHAEEVEKAAYGIFAVSPGDGFSDLFCELGANRIISGGQSMNPSADDIIDAINSYPCETAIILPNNPNIILAAQQVARILEDSGTNVLSVDTRTIPQGISALIAFNCDRTPEENLETMKSAMGDVESISITDAIRDAEADGISVKKNDKLGIIDGKIRSAKDTVEELIPDIFSLTKEGELITVYYGRDVDEEDAEEVAALITAAVGDDVDVSVFSGGQPVYDYIISVE